MHFCAFVTYKFTENAVSFIDALTRVDGARIAVISQDEPGGVPEAIARRLTANVRVADALNTVQVLNAARDLQKTHGRIHRILGAMEQIQVQLAEIREALEIDGMRVETARNFRDKARMKYIFHTGGVPTARFLGVSSEAEVWRFAEHVGYPIVIKPLQGAATQETFRVRSPDEMRAALDAVKPSPASAAIVEEFVVGRESSFETMSLDGRPLWHSWTHYDPTPLEVMENPQLMWRVVLPNNAGDPIYNDIREVNDHALRALGMSTGMTHLEWFRRRDGSLVIGEVAARPPGAQITTLVSRAFDIDFLKAWGDLMVHGVFVPPQRRYAAGACYLRGQGSGVVRAVTGWEDVRRELGALITDFRLPAIGQPKSLSYEGEGWVIVRDERTEIVEAAVRHISERVSVALS